MTASPAAQALPARANGDIRPCTDVTYADLHVSTMDGQGRLALRGPALAMGWSPGQDLALGIHDGMLHLSSPLHSAHAGSGVTVVLDSRWRASPIRHPNSHQHGSRDSAHDSRHPGRGHRRRSAGLSGRVRLLGQLVTFTDQERAVIEALDMSPDDLRGLAKRTGEWSTDRHCS